MCIKFKNDIPRHKKKTKNKYLIEVPYFVLEDLLKLKMADGWWSAKRSCHGYPNFVLYWLYIILKDCPTLVFCHLLHYGKSLTDYLAYFLYLQNVKSRCRFVLPFWKPPLLLCVGKVDKSLHEPTTSLPFHHRHELNNWWHIILCCLLIVVASTTTNLTAVSKKLDWFKGSKARVPSSWANL